MVPECWRDAIVAGRCRKSSTSFVAGGLVSYGTNLPDTWRQACVYVGRMGEKPLELPVVQPTKYRLVIKSQDGKTTRHRDPANAVQPRRRGDRISLSTSGNVQVSDAGMPRPFPRSDSRRPKSAKAGNRGMWAPTVQRALWGFDAGVSVGEVEPTLAIGSR